MAKKSAAKSGKNVATALLELLGVAIEEGLVQASDVAALVGEDEPKSKSKSKAKAKDEEEDEEEEEEEEEEESDVPDFDEMSEKEMKKFCKDNEIEIPKKVKGEDALREFLNEEFASDEEDDEEDEEEDGEEAPDFSEMNHKELKAFVKENDLDVPAKTLKDEDALREFLEEQFASDEDDEDDDEEDEDDEDAPDFDDMDHKELKAFVKENDLDVPAKTLKDEEKLRTWLEENFSSDDDEDEEDDEDDEEDDEGEWEDD